MAPLARTPSLKRLAAEPLKKTTPPTAAAQPSDWGHYDTGEKPPEDQNEDNEANDNDDTISWAGDGDHVTGEDFRFDSGKFGACGARCATRVYGAAPAACTAPLGFDEVDPEGRPKEACVACAANRLRCCSSCLAAAALSVSASSSIAACSSAMPLSPPARLPGIACMTPMSREVRHSDTQTNASKLFTRAYTSTH